MEIARAVEPAQIVKAGVIHHQRLAFPSSVGGAHPGVDRGLLRLAHVDHAIGARVLVGHKNDARGLYDLKREGHVGGARNPGHITFHFRIEFPAVGKIFLLLREGLGLIGDFAALDDAAPGGNGAERSHLIIRPTVAGMILQIRVCGVERLPDPIEVRMTVRGPGRAVGCLWLSVESGA